MKQEPAQRNEMPKFSRYEVIEELGRGGIGVIYRAWDPDLGTAVAIKTLQREQSTEAQIVRFQKEAQALRDLRHPDIPKVYNFAIDDNGNPYLVMEFIEGASLKELIEEGTLLPYNTSLYILQRLLEVLSYAHRNNVIHRDIKSDNIKVSFDEEGKPIVRVIDFGLAKTQSPLNEAGPTQAGGFLGSPAYMSPEQIHGGEIDRRSDLYSVGCVAYELFSGRLPFVADTAVAVFMMHLNDDPLTLSSATGREYPQELEDFVTRCLAKEPDDRFQSADEAIQAISQLFIDDTSSSTTQAVNRTPITGLLPASKDRSNVLLWLALPILTILVIAVFSVSGLIDFVNSQQRAANSKKPTPEQKKIIDQNDEYKAVFDLTDSQEWRHANVDDLDYLICIHGTDKLIPTLNGRRDAKFVRVTGEDDMTGATFNQLSPNSIYKLQIGSTGLNDEGLRSISSIKSLIQLNVGMTERLSERGLAYLKDLPNLNYLCFFAISKMPRGALRVISQLTAPTRIGLNSVRPFNHSDIALLARMPRLSAIEMHHMDLTDQDCESLTKIKGLNELSLLNNQSLTIKGLEKLSALPLKKLNLSGLPLSDHELMQVGTMFPHLTYLEIIKCPNLTQTGKKLFRKANPKCSVLDFEENRHEQF